MKYSETPIYKILIAALISLFSAQALAQLLSAQNEPNVPDKVHQCGLTAAAAMQIAEARDSGVSIPAEITFYLAKHGPLDAIGESVSIGLIYAIFNARDLNPGQVWAGQFSACMDDGSGQ